MFALLLAVPDFFAAVHAQDVAAVERMLKEDPQLAEAKNEKGRSAVTMALAVQKGEGFLPRAENKILDLILAQHPPLTDFETCAVGTGPEVAAALQKDPELRSRRSPNGWTALHFAAFEDNPQTAAVLLDAGAEVDARAKNEFNNTPLQVAMLTRSARVTRVLLARGASVKAVTHEGITALHEAASTGDAVLVKMLLEAGADPKVPSDFGSPLEIAEKNKHAEAAKLLRAAANR
jgi:ankyrin repeat protein